MAQSPNLYPLANLEYAFIDKKVLWAAVNSFVQNNKLGFHAYHWDKDIFIPLSTLLSHYDDVFSPIIAYPDYQIEHIPQLILNIATFSAWRYNLGVYNIPESLYAPLIADTNGYRISPKHIQHISEWTIYIPLKNVHLQAQTVHGVHVHTNLLDDGSPCLIMFLNNLTADSKNTFRFLPFALFRVVKTDNILEGLIECSSCFNQETFLEIFNPIFSLINLIGDADTTIESEIFGIHTPSNKDVKESLSFSNLNIPTFKYIAPSNIRNWNVGLNIAATQFKLETLHGQAAVSTVMWSDDEELKLIHPHI